MKLRTFIAVAAPRRSPPRAPSASSAACGLAPATSSGSSPTTSTGRSNSSATSTRREIRRNLRCRRRRRRSNIEPFDLAARGAGAFPSADRPRTLWLGAGQGTRRDDRPAGVDRTVRSKSSATAARTAASCPTSRSAAPAATSRPRSLATELAALADFDAGSMLVDEVTVFASQLTREGSEYRVLAHAPLAQ